MKFEDEASLLFEFVQERLECWRRVDEAVIALPVGIADVGPEGELGFLGARFVDGVEEARLARAHLSRRRDLGIRARRRSGLNEPRGFQHLRVLLRATARQRSPHPLREASEAELVEQFQQLRPVPVAALPAGPVHVQRNVRVEGDEPLALGEVPVLDRVLQGLLRLGSTGHVVRVGDDVV